MATWDFGGGCPCGVSKVCDCANRYKYNSAFENDKSDPILRKVMKMSNKHDFDFGFSTHTEDEIRIEDKTELKLRLNGLKNMISPLLNNLMKNPEQEIIKWPNRKEKIEEFIKKMDEYINDSIT